MEITNDIRPPKSKRGRKPKYPFAEMRKGASFHVAPEDVVKVSAAAYRHAKTYGKVFTVQEVKGEHRCWRIG